MSKERELLIEFGNYIGITFIDRYSISQSEKDIDKFLSAKETNKS